MRLHWQKLSTHIFLNFVQHFVCFDVLYFWQLAAAFLAVHAATLTTCLAGLPCAATVFAFRSPRFVCSLCACLHRQLLLLLPRLAACHKNKLKFKVMICTHTQTHATHTLRDRLGIQSTVNIKYVCGNILWRLKFKCNLLMAASKAARKEPEIRFCLLPFICNLLRELVGRGARNKAAAAVSFC